VRIDDSIHNAASVWVWAGCFFRPFKRFQVSTSVLIMSPCNICTGFSLGWFFVLYFTAC